MNSGGTWHATNAREPQGLMEIATNAMTLHALVQEPFQVDPEATSDAEAKTVEIMCFGAVADEMVGLPADSLVSFASDVQGCIPEQIKRMYGAKYDFSLSVPRGTVRFGRITFRIDSFTRIAELEEQAMPELAPGTSEGAKLPAATMNSTQTEEANKEASTPAKDVLDINAVAAAITPALDKKTEGGKLPAVTMNSTETEQANKEASTPAKDVLDINTVPAAITPALPKEKRAIIENSLGEGLEDSDCDTSMPSNKKPRAARKLSMIDSEGDE